MKRFFLLLMWLSASLPAATVSFNLLPTGGSISGTAGSTIGWGYSLANLSADQWLVPVSLNASPFVAATPNVLFAFPILAPGASSTEAFNAGAGSGLLALLLSSSLNVPVVNTGQFELQAEWWNGNPLAGGSYLSTAAPVTQRYQATALPQAAPQAVPEPSSAWQLLLGCAGLAVAGLRRRTVHGLRPR